MTTIIVRHTVADFDKWKPFFEENRGFRESHGITDGSVYRDASAANDVVIVMQVEDLARAKEFVASPDLKKTMQQAGVISEPAVWFLNDV